MRQEKNKGWIMRNVMIVSVLVCMALSWPPSASAQEEVAYLAECPTTGSPVHHYVWELSYGGVVVDLYPETTVPEYVATVPYGVEFVIRLKAVDAQDRAGPWSEWSEPYTPDLGAPAWSGGCIPTRRM